MCHSELRPCKDISQIDQMLAPCALRMLMYVIWILFQLNIHILRIMKILSKKGNEELQCLTYLD